MTPSPRDGIVLLDKPPGPTSHDLVSYVRRSLGMRRVGHTGTLDPAASGLLVMALGRATRLIRFLPDGPKTYVGTLVLGVRTDSDDLTGAVLERHGGDLPGPREVRDAATRLTGTTLQTPPAVSAKKVAGRRAYRLARAGEPVPVRPVEVVVDRFDVEPVEGDPGRFGFVATVSAGTYIRALARDLGRALGCGGTLATLRRTAIGPLSVEDAHAPPPPPPEPSPGRADGLRPDRVLPASDDALADRVIALDRVPLTPADLVLDRADDRGRFLHGMAVPLDPGPDSGSRAVRDGDGRLLGIGELAGGVLRPRVVLPDR